MPTPARTTRGWGRRKPPPGTPSLPGHPLIPDYALLFLERGGTKAGWHVRGLPRPGATWSAAAAVLPWSAEGVRAPGAPFDGGNVSQLNFNRGFTVVCRARTDSPSTGGLVGLPQGGYYLRLVSSASVLHLNFLQSRTVDIVSGATAVQLNCWHTCGATVSAGSTATCRAYLNGALDGSATFSGTFSSTNVRLMGDTSGGVTGGAIEVLSGELAWVYWYSRELSAAEMATIHAEPFCWKAAGRILRTTHVPADYLFRRRRIG